MEIKTLLSCITILMLFSLGSIQVSADGFGELVKLTEEQQEVISLLRLRQTNFFSIDYEDPNSSYIIRWEKLQNDGNWQAMELINEKHDGGNLQVSVNLEDFIRIGIRSEDDTLNTYEFMSSSLPNRIERENGRESLLGDWKDTIEIEANNREAITILILADDERMYSLNYEEINSDYENPEFDVEGVKDVFALTIEFVETE